MTALQNNFWQIGPIASNTTSQAMVADRLYLNVFDVPARTRFDEIGVNVTSTAAGTARLGIYKANPEGRAGTTACPGGPELGTVSVNSSGFQSVTFDAFEVTPGRYFLACLMDVAPSLARWNSATTDQGFMGYTSATGTRQVMGFYGGQAYSNGLPADASNFNSQLQGASVWGPAILIRVDTT